MTFAVRKLSYAFHDDDSRMTMKEVIGIPGDEAELQRIRGYDIMVTKFLLFKHAWKILRQLYMAASAKKMLMTMGALGTSKSLSKFLILLRRRTEFTKKNILGKCIGESKCLRRSWNNFHRHSLQHWQSVDPFECRQTRPHGSPASARKTVLDAKHLVAFYTRDFHV